MRPRPARPVGRVGAADPPRRHPQALHRLRVADLTRACRTPPALGGVRPSRGQNGTDQHNHREGVNMRDFMDSDRPADNGRKITAMLTEQTGRTQAYLYRTATAGPSGQRRPVCVGGIRWVPDGPYEFRISMPESGLTVGYATRRSGTPQLWTIWRMDYDRGIWLHGYTSVLSLGVDVLINGAHAATGRHDSHRTSGGVWQAYERKPWPVDDEQPDPPGTWTQPRKGESAAMWAERTLASLPAATMSVVNGVNGTVRLAIAAAIANYGTGATRDQILDSVAGDLLDVV